MSDPAVCVSLAWRQVLVYTCWPNLNTLVKEWQFGATNRRPTGWMWPGGHLLRTDGLEHHWYLSTEHRAQRILKDNIPVAIYSPYWHLAKVTYVCAAIPPDYREASFLRLWDSSGHPPHNLCDVVIWTFYLLLLDTRLAEKMQDLRSFTLRKKRVKEKWISLKRLPAAASSSVVQATSYRLQATGYKL